MFSDWYFVDSFDIDVSICICCVEMDNYNDLLVEIFVVLSRNNFDGFYNCCFRVFGILGWGR